jgi:S-layer protein (TIGR01567 family)
MIIALIHIMRIQHLLEGIIIVWLLIISAPGESNEPGMAASQLQDQSGEEGWYLQGEPVITKDQEVDLPPCYTSRTIEVSNGRAHGSLIVSSSPECFPHGGAGKFSGDVTWNPPPSYLKPNTTINFSVACTWTGPESDSARDSGLIGWNFGSGGTTIVDGDSRYPQPSKGSFIVPDNSAGDEMNVYVIANAVSGLFGNIVYKYKYQGGAELPPAAQPTEGTKSLPDLDDKIRQILKIYQKKVPRGIVDSGKLNNLLCWHPLKGKDFEPYTCGGYQSAVLKVLDELKFSEDPKERSLLDNWDYGPIEVQGGSHHAVVIYPKGTDWVKTGIILDPWIAQRPEAYFIKDWTDYFPDYWGPLGSSYYRESYPNYPTVGGTYKDPKVTGIKSGYPDKMVKKSGRAMGNCPLNLYLIDDAGRISGYSGDGRKDEITEAVVRRAPLSDGTYWTEMEYPADGSCMLDMKGLDNGDATIFIGFGMDGYDYRSIYRYNMEVESGRVYELDLRSEGSPIVSDADQIIPEKIEEIDIAWLNSQPDLASIPEIQIDGDEGTDGITEVLSSKAIFDSWNKDTVDNGPTCSPFFTIDEPMTITYIDTYHWNYGEGAPGGTIGLRDGEGTVHGPWQAESSGEGGEVPKGYWIAHPNEVIPAGSYTIEDSDPDTWSQNSKSPCGLTRVEGYPAESPASQNGDIPAADIKETASKASTKGTSSHPPNAESADSGVAGSAKPEQTLIEDGAYPAPSDRSVEIRGQVATGDFEWKAQNFAGFYYDPDNDVGTEALTATLTDGMLSGSQPYGLYYQTTAQRQNFAFRDWGSYLVLGFLGERHFAGYAESDSEKGYLFDQSGEKSSLAKGQLLKILLDDDTETTITTDTNLQLEDGYELSIKSIDIEGNVVDLELIRDGTVVDSGKVSPSKDGATIADQTYIYKKDNGDMKDVVVIAVHFKNAFRGADQDLATVDGLWQLSETPAYVSQGAEYDKMTVQSVTDDAIIMANQGDDITLSGNKDISIMPGMAIKTADADELRYYIYREIIEPGEFEIRSTVETADYAAWTASEFAGFYYDLNKDIGTEMLAATITDGKLAEPDGIRYTTEAIASDFKFEDWGSYQVMGFLGEKCFAGHIDGSDSGKAYLFEKSSNKSALAKGQLYKVLVDDDQEKTITSKTPLILEEGYRLELKHVDPDDGRVYANLLKGDKLVKDYMFQPSKDDATLSDKTCFFRDPSLGLVAIAVHFKNAFAGSDQNLATIDAIWQISESPISVARGTSFDKLTVSEVTDRSIVMNNIDQTLALSRDKNIALAGNLCIRTADTDFLRYYLVKEDSPSDLSRVEGYAAASEDVSPATGSNRMASEVEPNLEEAVSTPDTTSASNSLDELSYSDDFSDTNSGWVRASDRPDLDAMGYDDGRYHIIRKKPGQSWSSPPDGPIFSDFAVEVEANQEEGPDDNQYGLVLRRDASGNYYCFQISGAGNYRFDVNLNGNWREIVPDTWSSKINTGRDKNVLRVVCSGESFIFYANGAKIGEAQDSSITSGRLGLVAGSLDDQRLHISFDNLKVWGL